MNTLREKIDALAQKLETRGCNNTGEAVLAISHARELRALLDEDTPVTVTAHEFLAAVHRGTLSEEECQAVTRKHLAKMGVANLTAQPPADDIAAELAEALEAMVMEAKARNCDLRIADEALACYKSQAKSP